MTANIVRHVDFNDKQEVLSLLHAYHATTSTHCSLLFGVNTMRTPVLDGIRVLQFGGARVERVICCSQCVLHCARTRAQEQPLRVQFLFLPSFSTSSTKKYHTTQLYGDRIVILCYFRRNFISRLILLPADTLQIAPPSRF